MRRLFLIRHAPAESPDGYVGWSDPPLGERGISEARLVGERMMNEEGIEAVYSSDLARARGTAGEVARRLGVPVRERSGFREMNFGEWEGRSHGELSGGGRYEAWMRDPEKVSPPGGEAFPEFRGRVEHGFGVAVDEVERDFGLGASFAVVAHGGAIRIIVCRLLGMVPENHWRLGVSHSGITVFEWSGDVPVLRAFNDLSHISRTHGGCGR